MSRVRACLLCLLFECARTPPDAPVGEGATRLPAPVAVAQLPFAARLEVGWDPGTGRGLVRHHFANGDRLETCFQCDYPGYTGGLVIGGYGGSGLAFVPRAPIRGYASINVMCATDESIWDRDARVEYAFGWSENFGSGPDGKRLEYLRGAVLEGGPLRAALFSENQQGCYQVQKVATTRADAPWWVIATRITNRCPRPVHFDFFTGDDPWLGLYRSSDGDVGWWPDGLLEREAELLPFSSGGIYDLGNRALGQDSGAFSNQADFFALDPTSPPPDRAFIANRFAHHRGELDPQHLLSNQQMVALNLGWSNRTLGPGQSFTVALAQGLAQTFEPSQVPQVPPLSDADWSAWRAHLPQAPGTPLLDFAAEDVTLTVGPGRLSVEGRYHLVSSDSAAGSALITYPIFTDPEQPAPGEVQVDGRWVPVEATLEGPAARFEVPLAPRGLTRFRVDYVQTLGGRRATYRVTSARSWPRPLTRAAFEVRLPRGLGEAHYSYPVTSRRRTEAGTVDRFSMGDFRPGRELVVEW